MEEQLKIYYADNAYLLRRTVDRILKKFGGLSDKDNDDFYSLANEVFVDAVRRCDPTQSFDVFLYACLCNQIKTEITRRNREKRRAERISVSLDEPLEGEECMTLADMIADGYTVEREVFEKREAGFSRRLRCYLGRLSKRQREVLQLHADGYSPKETREALHLSRKQYADCCAAIHSYRNISVLL